MKRVTGSMDEAPRASRPGSEGLGVPYDDSWYDKQMAELLASARVYVAYLWRFVQPRTVLDVGCGRGAWLAAWHEAGAQRLIGYDGHWNSAAKMVDAAIRFTPIDLNGPFCVDAPVDLAMSLETAEHLDPASGPGFVASLARTSDLVLFSAAYSFQGGTHHVNEQPHSYWAGQFALHGFAPFDLLRPVFWGDARVCYWYRQNAFLYARRDSAAWQALCAQGCAPMAHPGFMDCVHPELYRIKVDGELPLSVHLKDLWPSFRRALRRRLRGP